MKKQSIVAPMVLAMVLGLAGCGDSNGGGSGGMSGSGGSAGMSGSGGTAGVGGSAGMGANVGMGGMVGDDCSRICESPCVEEVIPGGMVDDCINACRMGSFMCIPELIAALECIEMIDCDIVADPCIAQSTALTICLAG